MRFVILTHREGKIMISGLYPNLTGLRQFCIYRNTYKYKHEIAHIIAPQIIDCLAAHPLVCPSHNKRY